jgi:hypothetical protein
MRLGPSGLHVVSWTSGLVGRHCAEARDREIDHDQAGNNNPITDFDENIGLLSIPQVLSCLEDLFCLSLHGRPQLEGKNIEELITAIAAMHNVIRAGGGEVIPT